MSDDKKLLQRVVTEQGQFLDHQLAATMSNMKIGLYRVFTLPKFNKHCEVLVSCSDWVDWIDFIELHACNILSKAGISTACEDCHKEIRTACNY